MSVPAVDLSKKKALVLDYGLFEEIAIKIAKEFERVYYWTPWKSEYPKSNPLLKGYGLEDENVERVKSWEPYIDKVDVTVFPDVGEGPLVQFLREKGYRVWGSGISESLELHRWEAKKLIAEWGMPLPHSEHIFGTKSLRTYLKDKKNVWVKISMMRGDNETFQSTSFEDIENDLDELEFRLGPKKDIMEFIVEDDISEETGYTDKDGNLQHEPVVEIGYDGYCIDGVYPRRSMIGYEIKSTGYLGAMVNYRDLPDYMRLANEKCASYMGPRQYRNFFSTELRVRKENGKNVSYLVDPCCRAGSPPNEVYQEVFTNLPQIIWQGAGGVCIDPEPIAPYAVMLAMYSDKADKMWVPVKFPKEIRQWVKLRNFCKINGIYYVIPTDFGRQQIGAIVGVGKTPEEACAHCIENCEQIGPKGKVEIKIEALEEAVTEAKKGEAVGIKLL